MSDSQKVYHKVFKPLKRAIKNQPTHRLQSLAQMISALVRGSNVRLSKLAAKTYSKAKQPSTIKRFHRWLDNPHVKVESFYAPFVSSILTTLSRSTLYIAMDASSVGRGCQALVAGVIYKKRLLPVTWLVYKGKKGHAPAHIHIQLLRKLKARIPAQARVVLLADGEYDNIEDLAWIQKHTSWDFVIRTAKSKWLVYEEGGKPVEKKVKSALGLKKGEKRLLPNAMLTKQKHGPVNMVGVWDEEYEHPIYLVTSLERSKDAAYAYEKRYVIETLFSDQKGRGFGIDKSHISKPERLERLLLVTSLAYIWMVYFGVLVLKEEQWDLIDCTRQDKSLFRLGLDWLEHLLNHDLEFRAMFFIRGVM